VRRQLEHVEDTAAAMLRRQVGGDGGVDAPALGQLLPGDRQVQIASDQRRRAHVDTAPLSPGV
jgi:hypothetical protein